MKRILVIAAGIALAGVMVIPGTAYAVPTQALCASHGSGLCLSDDGEPVPSPITSQNFNGGINQTVTVRTNTAACGNGKVSNANSCPFTPGSGNNTVFNGKTIATIEFTQVLTCIASNTAFTGVQRACNGTGTDFVIVGPNYVNVWATNNNGDAITYLQSLGLDLDVQMEATGSPSNWALHS